MKKRKCLLFLVAFVISGLYAQQQDASGDLPVIALDDIELYNKINNKTFGLYTPRENIENLVEVDISKPYWASQLPFFDFPYLSPYVFPSIYSKYFEYIILIDDGVAEPYAPYYDDNIMITQVRENDSIIITVRQGQNRIILNKDTKIADLAAFFNQSAKYENNPRKNIYYKVIVTKDTERACLVIDFKDDRFCGLMLWKLEAAPPPDPVISAKGEEPVPDDPSADSTNNDTAATEQALDTAPLPTADEGGIPNNGSGKPSAGLIIGILAGLIIATAFGFALIVSKKKQKKFQ